MEIMRKMIKNKYSRPKINQKGQKSNFDQKVNKNGQRPNFVENGSTIWNQMIYMIDSTYTKESWLPKFKLQAKIQWKAWKVNMWNKSQTRVKRVQNLMESSQASS